MRIRAEIGMEYVLTRVTSAQAFFLYAFGLLILYLLSATPVENSGVLVWEWERGKGGKEGIQLPVYFSDDIF